ncbi:peptidase family M49-domain-containing protein [Syncephalis plumigaleata]|nr:peptidase family M49-domain-containing protein [Syncephalis plumigaleata]
MTWLFASVRHATTLVRSRTIPTTAARLSSSFPLLSQRYRRFSTANMTAQDPSPAAQYYADKSAPICPLVIKEHFDTLTDKEKRYAYHIAQASWLGARVILEQTTPYSSDLFDLIRLTFSVSCDAPHQLANLDELRARANVDEDAFVAVQEYAAQCLGNLANFKSFGDVKFIPRVPADTFRKVVAASALKDEIYTVQPTARTLLGYPEDGHVTNYYTNSVTKADIKVVQEFCESRHMDPLNTREAYIQGSYILLIYGDFHPQMAAIAAELKQAIPYAANDHQRRMLEHYASQREWIRDIGPVVESNIGFVESYRDPAGVRAEFEGFVAVVNKEMTKKFERLVNSAPDFIPKLPWGADFEKDEFRKPDFTSLEILTFATGGVPAGINIPNYDDIRQTFGFKNVSLGNVLNAKAPDEKIHFLSDADRELFKRLRGPSFEVQVGIHELLGTHWYGAGETWGSRFKAIAPRTRMSRGSRGHLPVTYPEMLAIFEEGLADDVLYIGWLQMCRAGLVGLEFYDPEAKKWGQAHMQARYAILRVLLNAGQDLVTVKQVGDDDLLVSLDRQKIRSVGVPAIGHF